MFQTVQDKTNKKKHTTRHKIRDTFLSLMKQSISNTCQAYHESPMLQSSFKDIENDLHVLKNVSKKKLFSNKNTSNSGLFFFKKPKV